MKHIEIGGMIPIKTKKILVLNVPAQSLILPSLYDDVVMGASIVAGSLTEAGYDVSHYDLNISLNRIRLSELNLSTGTDIYQEDVPGRELSEEEFSTLTNANELQNSLNAAPPERIARWIKLLYQELLSVYDLNSFDVIVYSLERRTIDYYVPISEFSFTLLFNNFLKAQRDNDILTYAGGRTSIRFISESGFFDDLNSLDSRHLLTRVFFGNGEDTFPNYLDEHLEQDEINPLRMPLLYDLHKDGKFPSKGCIPKIPQNFNNGGVTTRIFSENVISQFPELASAPKVIYANYAFSIGCPFNCAFCGEDRSLTKYDVDNAVEAFKYYQDQGVQYLRLFNNNINFNLNWTKELCNKLVQNNINIKWTDSANLRVYDKEMIDGLAEAGCIKLWWGTETVIPRILKIINKEVPVGQIEEVLQLTHDVNIWNQCNIIINFPTETDDEFSTVIDFLEKYYGLGIVNGYQVNTFQVLGASGYYKTPEKFNIELIKNSDMNLSTEYNEINGKSWKEVVAAGNRKQNIVRNSKLLPSNFDVFTNEPLFFKLHSAYNGNLPKIKEVLNFISENDHENAIRDMHWCTRYVYRTYWNNRQK